MSANFDISMAKPVYNSCAFFEREKQKVKCHYDEELKQFCDFIVSAKGGLVIQEIQIVTQKPWLTTVSRIFALHAFWAIRDLDRRDNPEGLFSE